MTSKRRQMAACKTNTWIQDLNHELSEKMKILKT